MRLDLSVIKNESILKLEKAHNKVLSKFVEMLSIALDAAVHEIDPDKRSQVEMELMDIFGDEFGKFKLSYTKTLNKVAELVETKLG